MDHATTDQRSPAAGASSCRPPACATRRGFLTGAALVPVAAGLTSCASPTPPAQQPTPRPTVAAVYRGSAGCDGCAETLAERLAGAPLHMEVTFVGPDEEVALDAGALDGIDLYVQPGGGDDIPAAAAEFPAPFVEALQEWVRGGGRYLGVCMGAYLAGNDGFGLIPRQIDGEVGAPGFPVVDSADHLVAVTWDGTRRWTYFQEGARLPERGAVVHARYETGDIAAARYVLGQGRIGLIGPHPEADGTWLKGSGLIDEDGDDWAYALPLVRQLVP